MDREHHKKSRVVSGSRFNDRGTVIALAKRVRVKTQQGARHHPTQRNLGIGGRRPGRVAVHSGRAIGSDAGKPSKQPWRELRPQTEEKLRGRGVCIVSLRIAYKAGGACQKISRKSRSNRFALNFMALRPGKTGTWFAMKPS